MVQAHRIKAVALVGCTAVGKSETALRLAERLDGELVGADSMQIYRGFDIGTGKLTREQCRGVVHHMLDVVEGDAQFSVGDYVERATAVISDIDARKKLPIVVGGTGLYVYSLFSGFNFADSPKDNGVRNALKAASHFFGSDVLHRLLFMADPTSAQNIAVNDVKRTIRALEIFRVSGGRAKSLLASAGKPYDDLTVVLTLPRELLYARINARVHEMFDEGLMEEARSLMRYKDCQSMQALGYKQIAAFPDMTRAEMEALVAQKTRNYAKRQTTFFNNMKLNKIFIDVRDYASVERTVREFTEQ